MSVLGEGFYPYQVGLDAYGNGGFRFAEMSHRGSLLCLPSGMHAWAPLSRDSLTPADFDLVFTGDDRPEVLFIGLGEDIAQLPAAIRNRFNSEGIQVEGLSTGSAISTYNIMFGEKRSVGAALLAVERPSRVPK